MRKVVYQAMLAAPFRVAAMISGTTGIIGSLWPEKVKDALDSGAFPVQTVSIVLMGAALVYFFLLWLLKPGESDKSSDRVTVTGSNATIIFANTVREAAQILEDRGSDDGKAVGALPSLVVTPPQAQARSVPIKVDDATHKVTSSEPVVLRASNLSTPPPEIGSATLRSISNLFTGQVIVSAARLAEQNILELGVRAFNGWNETLLVSGLGGHISAGIDNAVGQNLSKPRLPNLPSEPIPPRAEFFVVIDQVVAPDLAANWLSALEAGKSVSLDLRELRVMLESKDAPTLHAKLPLWNGASIRRREDIFTSQIVMGAIGVAEESDTLTATGKVEGKPDE